MARLNVKKTYKLYIGGKFPRTESGRTMEFVGKDGEVVANLCRGSRKDFRNAVVVAGKAQGGWSGASAYLKGQIIYRIAEMLEGRRAQFIDELKLGGMSAAEAKADVDGAVDLLVHYAGWSDKYQALFSSVNPVASAHFNFSNPGPMGVVGVLPPTTGGLLGFLSAVLPVIVGGNSAVVLVSGEAALSAISFAEVLHTSDLPGGVMNVISCQRGEVLEHVAKHMDVQGVLLCSGDAAERKICREEGAESVKQVKCVADGVLDGSPYLIMDFQEIKTTWHPVGV